MPDTMTVSPGATFDSVSDGMSGIDGGSAVGVCTVGRVLGSVPLVSPVLNNR